MNDIIIRAQSAMRTYLAMKHANALKYGSYGFKDFNEDWVGDYKNDIVDRVIDTYGQYKFDKSVSKKYDNRERTFRGMETQENGAKYQGEWDEENDVKHGQGTMIWKDGSR